MNIHFQVELTTDTFLYVSIGRVTEPVALPILHLAVNQV